ncbi:MAG TPA: 2-oxoacid:acceptor oxidoreductase family protein [Nitrospirota bacterium]|nr:2-oxoacid:acceptor oxidoreductase family protein [Nitrospirota bacterium]
MFNRDVIIAGFGGQGVLLAGKLLAWAGMLGGKRVTWFPSYGAEMRGGTANCTVIISDDEIGSPVVDSPGALVALNQASADKFSGKVAKGGLILLNSSLVKSDIKRAGVKVVKLPANELAQGLGSVRVVNMIMLGAYVRLSGAATLKDIARAMDESLPDRNKPLIPVNLAALEKGYSLVGG